MNKENVQHAINIMERAKASKCPLEMEAYQDRLYRQSVKTTEKELHSCATPACIAGHIAVSPEWREFGGGILCDGAPALNDTSGGDALAAWMGIQRHECSVLCCEGQGLTLCGTALGSEGQVLTLYERDSISEIDYVDVITVLCRLRDTGSIWPKTPQSGQPSEPQ